MVNVQVPSTPGAVSATGPMVLPEDNVELVLEEMRGVLGNIFGYEEENREVGITGKVNFVEIEGPIVIVAFEGEFWHRRTDVLKRVENFLCSRIPEVAAVEVSDEDMLVERRDKGIYHKKG